MPVCNRNCEWGVGTKSLSCPEFGSKIYRRWCELACTKSKHFEHFRDVGLPGIERHKGTEPKSPKSRQDVEKDKPLVQKAASLLDFPKKMLRYTRALTRWAKAGFPVRSPEEIERVVAICEACPTDDYDLKLAVCTFCKCPVRRTGMPVRNKAKMATEMCPKGHWQTEAEQTGRLVARAPRDYIAMAVMTAPRRVDYLPRMLRSLSRAGFCKPLVCQALSEIGGVPAHRPPWLNFLHAIQSLVERVPGAAYYAVFQDDILVARFCCRWLGPQIKFLKEHAQIVSLYTSEYVAMGRQPGWFGWMPNEVSANLEGAVALLLRRDVARTLLADPGSPGSMTNIEYLLGRFCAKHDITVCQHVPSLVEHVGVESSIPTEARPGGELGPHRQAGIWVRDARDLISHGQVIHEILPAPP